MAVLDTNSYYFGLGIAIILGYVLSSLRVERLFIAAIMVLPERVNGKSLNKEIISERNNITNAEQKFPTPSFISGWTEDNIFELERRAIFSKTWLHVTHASRFQRPGDYRTYDLAGFSLIIILGKDKQLRTFHNVCRHRAYAVTKKECGSSTVLGCRYHGWSYDTKGNLIKAPEFDNVPGFDKGKNGLWEVKTEVREGMVFINFEARRDVEHTNFAALGPVLRTWGTATMKCISDWKIEAAVNWKSLGCLESNGGSEIPWWRCVLPLRFQKSNENLRISSTSIARRLSSGIVVVFTAFPKSANSTIIECSIFVSKPPRATCLETLKRDTSSEIDQLIATPQESRGRGLSCSFPIFVPQHAEINELLEAHHDAESRAGAEIHPAARNQNFSLEGKADDDFCKELDGGRESVCSAGAKGLLDW